MKLLNIRNKLVSKNVIKYLIDWDKPSRSKVQFAVKQFLRPYWKNHIGVYEEFPVFGSLLKVDFLNAQKKIAIEVNGTQHETFNPFFHNNSREVFRQGIKRDVKKAEFLENNGFFLIEIKEDEVKNLSLKWINDTFNISII